MGKTGAVVREIFATTLTLRLWDYRFSCLMCAYPDRHWAEMSIGESLRQRIASTDNPPDETGIGLGPRVFFHAVRRVRDTDGCLYYEAVGPRRERFGEALRDDPVGVGYERFVSLYREVDGYLAEWIADLDRDTGELVASRS